MRKHHKIQLYILLAIIYIGAGCKSTKPTIQSKQYISKGESITQIAQSILDSQYTYNTLWIRTNIEITDPKNKTSNIKTAAQIRIIKDSTILISIHPFIGLEVARIVLTQDSILIINRYDKEYIHQSFHDIFSPQPLPLNISNIQDILVGQLFQPGTSRAYPTDFTHNSIKQGILSISSQKEKPVLAHFNIDGNKHIIATTLTRQGKEILSANYHHFVEDNHITYPSGTDIKFKIENKSVKLTFNHSKVEINKNFTIDTHVPKGYKEITLKEILSFTKK